MSQTAVEIVRETIASDQAREHIAAYFDGCDGGQPKFTGSWFERLDGGGDREGVADVITAADLVAVTMLSVKVPPRAAIRILDEDAGRITELLSQIPTDATPATPEGRELLKKDGSPAHLLHTLLKTEYTGVGWVTAGKLMARKRPALIPVYDDIVMKGVKTPTSWWVTIVEVFTDGDVTRRLAALRQEARLGPCTVSDLRLLDIVLWMEFRSSTDPAG